MKNTNRKDFNATERREAIIYELCQTSEPIPAKVFAVDYHVSRQVIVQDITVLRAGGHEIISTNKGYILCNKKIWQREYKVHHGEERVEEELTLIVNLGGAIKNVSVSHRVYGRITAELPIRCKKDIDDFLGKIANSSSLMLGNVTKGYHYHLIEAESEETLDLIEEELMKNGLLAERLPWEK